MRLRLSLPEAFINVPPRTHLVRLLVKRIDVLIVQRNTSFRM